MATKKVYPFITARLFAGDSKRLEEHNISFDAREVAYYHYYEDFDSEEEDIVTVGFKSGKEIDMYLGIDEELNFCDNLTTAINKVQYSHFWHDNEDSTPNENED